MNEQNQKRLLSICIAALLLLNSCNIKEDIWLNKSGGGKYQYNIETTTLGGQMLMQNKNESMGDGNLLYQAIDHDVDSVVPLGIFLETLKPFYPKVYEKSRLHIKSKVAESSLIITLQIPFTSIRELNEGISNIWGQQALLSKTPFEDSVNTFSEFYELNGSVLKRKRVGDFSEKSPVSQDQYLMAKMMLQDATQTITIHTPRKPKTTSYQDGKMTDTAVSVTFPFLDIISGKKVLAGNVVF
jgi:hypothetical protein